jgi:hydrogenase nickel incorporation protein HypB
MCGICGCGEGEIKKTGNAKEEKLLHHTHDHGDQSFLLHIEQDLLTKNNQFAENNRNYFKKNNILTLNIVSSPGSGKTTLLIKTIETLKDKISVAVIEGDQHTEIDANRIRETKIPVIQVNTGKICHLDAHQISRALEELNPNTNSILFIENVGNLICPSLFDLGETYNVVVLSVTEGEDKPLKYPDIFYRADMMIINKIDLLPYVNFDVEKSINNARQINPTIKIVKTSATTQMGLTEWSNWLLECHMNKECFYET